MCIYLRDTVDPGMGLSLLPSEEDRVPRSPWRPHLPADQPQLGEVALPAECTLTSPDGLHQVTDVTLLQRERELLIHNYLAVFAPVLLSTPRSQCCSHISKLNDKPTYSRQFITYNDAPEKLVYILEQMLW